MLRSDCPSQHVVVGKYTSNQSGQFMLNVLMSYAGIDVKQSGKINTVNWLKDNNIDR